MYSIIDSDFLKWQNDLKYYNDISKFAKLAAWLLNSFGAEIEDLKQFIGDMPSLYDNIERELTEDDEELIKFAKENGLKYKVTNKGIKIST